MRRVWLTGIAALLCLFAAATYAAMRTGPLLTGTVVDARSGRVAAGATLTYDGRSLRRYRSRDFSFAGAASQAATLKAEAPGYEPSTIEVPAGTATVAVALKPRS